MVTVGTEIAKEQSQNGQPQERIPWTPKGIWGHKDPASMTLEEKKQMLAKAQYSGPLATAYWENEIKNHNEQPDREEANQTRQRAQELENEVARLNREIAEIRAQGGNESEVQMNQQLAQDAQEELQEKKKGIGSRFKDGVLGFYSSFKSGMKNAWDSFGKKKEEQEERPSEGATTERERGSTERSSANVGSGEPSRANPEQTQEPEKLKLEEGFTPEERQKKIEDLKAEIERLREERYQRSREVGVIEQTKIEEEYNQKIKDLENQILKLEKGEHKKIDRKGVLGFLWERTKGMVGFGWWEAHQAEKFRLGTKETGKDLNAQSELLQQEEGLILDPEEAWEEAHEIESEREREEKDLIENLGMDPKEAREEAVEFLSAKISGRKREYNKKVEDKMVAGALVKLEDKLKNKSWVQEYMAANGGKVITPEKMQEVEKRIREEIGKLRKGQLKKDFVNFVKLSRDSLDKRWWSRYIYAGLDAVLAGLFFKWIVSKGVEKAVAGKTGAGKVAAKEIVQGGLKDTVWGDTDGFINNYLQKHGLSAGKLMTNFKSHDDMLLHFSKMVAEDSGVTVPDWGITGKILDTQMPANYILKFGRVAAELAKLAA